MSASHPRPLVVVIATGGTIASKRRDDGATVPQLSAGELMTMLPAMPVRLRSIDLMARDSSSLTLRDMQEISDLVGVQLADSDVAGIVVLHGTDTMEETSLLVALQHRLNKPVIFTGAQFSLDDPRSDGAVNLAAAIEQALQPTSAAQSVQIAFGGRLLPALAAYKSSSDQPDAFSLAGMPIGGLPYLPSRVGDHRVDIVAVFPGCDACHLDASFAAGASGIVLAALGSGNANAKVVDAVARCTARGVPVVVSSRVPQGELRPIYGGGGGGHDLKAAGAIQSRLLRPSQARILLAALIASSDNIAAHFAAL